MTSKYMDTSNAFKSLPVNLNRPTTNSNVNSFKNDSVELLVHRLCSKIASVNNLNEKSREEFINNSYAYIVKLICSDAFLPTYDTLEVSQKIKKKRKMKLKTDSSSIILFVLFNSYKSKSNDGCKCFLRNRSQIFQAGLLF
jgi:hypothetical protein